MNEETCRRYDVNKTLSVLLEKMRENSLQRMKKDTDSIENRLFTIKLEDCGTVSSCYNEIRTLFGDLESCGQPKLTNQ